MQQTVVPTMSQSCNLFITFFIASQCMLLLGFVHISKCNRRSEQTTIYPAFSEARKHFIDSLGSLTVLREADPQIAEDTYLQSPGLTREERDSMRYFIKDYIEFHTMNRENGTKYLIFRPFDVGIGNRFEGLIYAYWAAVVSRRVFMVDWHDPFPLKDFLTEANELRIILSKAESTAELMRGSVVALNNTEESLIAYESVLASDVTTVIMETNRQPSLSLSVLFTRLPNTIKPSQARSFRENPNFQRAFLHHILRLSQQMKEDMQAFFAKSLLSGNRPDHRSDHQAGIMSHLDIFRKPRRPYIAVHARIGEGVAENAIDRFKRIVENQMVAAMCLASRAVRLAYLAGSPALPLYLATDTPAFRGMFKDVVSLISHGRVDVITGNWSVIHSAFLRRKLRNGTKVRVDNDWEAMWGTYMDLVILGHGEHMLALHSSFPRFAFGLGNSETLTELKNEVCLSEKGP